MRERSSVWGCAPYQISYLEGTYALIRRFAHALAGNHDAGSASRSRSRLGKFRRLDANQPVVDSHLDHVVGGRHGASRLVVLEEPCRDNLGPQELDAIGREALLEQSARPAV